MRVSPHRAPNISDDRRVHLTDLFHTAAQSRGTQLADLPHDPSPVGVAHRASVTRILESILAAQARLDDGTYGSCLRCEQDIDDRSQQLRPWGTLCHRCTGR